jgi:hypothetical protein
MRNRSSAMLTALAAALVLAFAVGSASANRLSYTTQGFRINWARLTFSESGGGLAISCPVTLEGSFHARTMTKVSETLVAHITRAAIGICQEGTATILTASYPWHVTYQSYSGTLPSITGVRHQLIGAEFQVEPGLGIRCLARTSTTFPAAGDANREAGGNITSLSADSELLIPVTGSPLCPQYGIFSGSGEVHVLGSTSARVRLSLI